jgi:hypothetical protein
MTLKDPVHLGERDARAPCVEGRHILDPPSEWRNYSRDGELGRRESAYVQRVF